MRITEKQAKTIAHLTSAWGDAEINETPEEPGSIGCTLLSSEGEPAGPVFYIAPDGEKTRA